MLLKTDKGLCSREIQGVSFIVPVITATSYRKPGSVETLRDSCQVLGYDKGNEVQEL
jgi:hypothetical protein